MKKLLLIILICILFTPLLANARGLMMVGGGVAAGGADATPPEVSTATIASGGLTLTLSMSETVTRTSGTFDLDCSVAGNNIVSTYASGSGSNSLVYDLSTKVNSGDTCNLDYNGAANGVEDAAGNDLATITNKATTNDASGTAPTYVINEMCDGTGTPAEWTEYTAGAGGTYNWDYTTSPAPLQGTQSLRTTCNSGGSDWEVWYTSFAEMSNFYMYFMFNVTSKPATTKRDIVHLDNDAMTQHAAISWSSTDKLELWDDARGGTVTTYSLSTNTTYHVWLDRVQNGTMSVYIATSPTKPGSPEWTVNPCTNDGVGIVALITDPSVTIIIDNIKMDNASIGSNP
jgi:hypothetical protein